MNVLVASLMWRVVAGLLLLCSTVGQATTVYKTVDKNGVPSFSDTPPTGSEQAEVLQLSPTPAQSPDEYLKQLEAMREGTDRMAADRRAREKHLAELKEIRARTRSYEQTPETSYTEYVDYYPQYRRHQWRKPRPPWRPGYRPSPEHPIVTPYRVGGQRLGTSSNTQLMRPLVSTSSAGSGSSNSQLMRPLVSSRP